MVHTVQITFVIPQLPVDKVVDVPVVQVEQVPLCRRGSDSRARCVARFKRREARSRVCTGPGFTTAKGREKGGGVAGSLTPR